MNEQLPDKRLERLAQLVGDAVARRWMKILDQRRAVKKRPPRQPPAGAEKTPNK